MKMIKALLVLHLFATAMDEQREVQKYRFDASSNRNDGVRLMANASQLKTVENYNYRTKSSCLCAKDLSAAVLGFSGGMLLNGTAVYMGMPISCANVFVGAPTVVGMMWAIKKCFQSQEIKEDDRE